MDINNDAALLEELSFDNFRNAVLKDYQCACESRETSLLGRREVLTGKAKFGIFGDGKEIAQVAAAKFFKAGDWLGSFNHFFRLFLSLRFAYFLSSFFWSFWLGCSLLIAQYCAQNAVNKLR